MQPIQSKILWLKRRFFSFSASESKKSHSLKNLVKFHLIWFRCDYFRLNGARGESKELQTKEDYIKKGKEGLALALAKILFLLSPSKEADAS